MNVASRRRHWDIVPFSNNAIVSPIGHKWPDDVSFSDNMRLLWNNGKFDYPDEDDKHLDIRMPDTILFRNRKPKTWLFTSKNGFVMKKNSKNVVYSEIMRTFGKKSQDSSNRRRLRDSVNRTSDNDFICVARFYIPNRQNLRVEFLKSHQLVELFDDPSRMQDLVALQTCVVSDLARYTAYSTVYELSRDGLSFKYKTVILSQNAGLANGFDTQHERYHAQLNQLLSDGEQARTLYLKQNEVVLHSTAVRVNRTMQSLTKRIVDYVESHDSSRKIGMLRTEFIIDQATMSPVLTHISDVVFREVKPQPSPRPFVDMKRPVTEQPRARLTRLESLAVPKLRDLPMEPSTDASCRDTTLETRIIPKLDNAPIATKQNLCRESSSEIEKIPLPSNEDSRSASCVYSLGSPEMKSLVRRLAAHKTSTFKIVCAGMYCKLADDMKLSANSVHDTVLLLTIIQAAVLGAEITHKSDSQRMVIFSSSREFQIQYRSTSHIPPSASEIARVCTVSLLRLYASVPVCTACLAAYKMIERDLSKKRFGRKHV